MATTLLRPSVRVIQQTTPSVSAASAPSLIPCIVGACYQIVSPYTSEGALDANSKILTPARVTSSDVISTPIAVEGLSMRVQIDGGASILVTFPYSRGTGLSAVLVQATINRALAGKATALFVEGVLVIETVTKGSGASITLQAVTPEDGDAAYTVLKLTEGRVSGASGYDNLMFTLPFSGLPITKTTIKNLTFSADAIQLYRLVSKTLKQLSATSAPLGNAYALGKVTSFNGTTGLLPASCQPVVGGLTTLHARGASLSNTVYADGAAASVTIPLGFAYGHARGAHFPDASGARYLRVTANTAAQCLADASLNAKYVGAAGNAVQVILERGVLVPPVFDESSDTLTVTVAADTTYADLASILDQYSDAATYLTISLVYPTADAETCVLGTYDSLPASPTDAVYLTGGEDPCNFKWTDRTDLYGAVVGSVGIPVGTPPAGAINRSLWMSLNGCPAIEVPLVAGTIVATQINTAVSTALNATLTPADEITLSGRDTAGLMSFRALRITGDLHGTAYARTWQDSTVQVWGDATVLQALFAGASNKSITGLSTAAVSGGIDLGFNAEDYNAAAVTTFERMLVPGNQQLTLNGMTLPAAVMLQADRSAVDWSSLDTKQLVVTDGTTVSTVVFSISPSPTPTYAEAVAEIIAQLPGSLGVTELSFGSTGALVISQLTGRTLKLTSGTSNEVLAAFGLRVNGTNDALVDLLVSPATGQRISMADTGDGNVGIVTAIQTGLANLAVPATVSFQKTSTAHMTAYLFGGTDGLIDIRHNTGSLELYSTVEHSGSAATLQYTSSSRLDVSWKQYWANCCGPTVLEYSRVFHGGTSQLLAGDLLYNGNSVVGRVVKTQDLTVGTGVTQQTFPNAQIVLADAAAQGILTSWHTVATGLDSTVRDIAPEMSVNMLTSTLSVKHALSRTTAGIAMGHSSVPMYAGYSALRRDVSAADSNPQLLTFNDATEVDSLIGPIVPENPLAFGLAQALGAMLKTQITGLGVDDVTADAPYGTPKAFERAFELLQRKEIAFLTPMTDDWFVGQMAEAHCRDQSGADGKHERKAIISLPMPTEETPTAVISGFMTISDETPALSGKYVLTFKPDEHADILAEFNNCKDANGEVIVVSAGTDLLPEQGVWLDRTGDGYRYLVTKVIDAQSLQIEVQYPFSAESGAGTSGNGDLYYRESASALASFEAAGEHCTINVRQPGIDLSTPSGKDKAIAALLAKSESLSSRYCLIMMPDKIAVDLAGTTTAVSGFYAGAIWAGMSAYQPVKQGFTNFTCPGIVAVYGSDDTFTDQQMSAAGGVNWLVRYSDVAGSPIVSRFQLTTDMSSLETREWSIVRSLDLISKAIRSVLNRYLGRYTGDNNTLLQANMELSALCGQLSGSAAAEVSVTALGADSKQPDKLAAAVHVKPWYPINGIDIVVTAGNN